MIGTLPRQVSTAVLMIWPYSLPASRQGFDQCLTHRSDVCPGKHRQ